ncbi:response regulator [Algibacter lectus]|uniref:LuxR family two component transcriptional regulator n=1 Tax=Algibacter lectus TaxID=221126 RepID=A0A090VBZ5_9FLAO|nr:response regulator transcription factor [Algibacter lectus]MWW24088.1 response regulator [Algibacter lectus]TDY62104.1 LuxR family two component transcriptional regulator [Algibacter lectus]GAL60909.1 putative two-component system response regulator [Algibacter lectus]SFC77685.1 DNA-binding response regulator, NarL/FixJ family, contains REC and HTH domains [Algibacter lectus]
MNTNIVIADDHPLMLRGLTDFLTNKGFNIIGSAEDGKAAYNLIIKLEPEIAILDIRMPFKTGLEIAEACKKHNLPTKIILITFDKEEEVYDQAIQSGVYGYILKEFAVEEIETCIQHVLDGKRYFSEEIASYLNHNNNARPKNLGLLTKSELRIVRLISESKTSQIIAEELSISVRTVDKHRSNIVSKLNLDKKPTSLAIWATVNKEFL